MMNIISRLNSFKDEEQSDLMVAIIDDVLGVSTDEIEVKEYMENVIDYGCATGIVSSFIYTYQCTHCVEINYTHTI